MTGSFHHDMPFGAALLPQGGVRFRLWAPTLHNVGLALEAGPGALDTPLPMAPLGEGWFELELEQAAAGTRYRFVLPDGVRVPDPASRAQPDDVHGVSEVIDPAAYDWQQPQWRGRPWHEAVLYELHVGSFAQAASFDGVRRHLDHLAALGVTALELMPVGEFPGRRNWGYDGVQPFAPERSYGTPEALKLLIDSAHERGLMVLLDVVYNHFGPDGNFLHDYARDFFTDRHHTPWGAAINFDGTTSRPVRDFFIHNALYWLEEYRFDGLRFDAVHAIMDDSDPDILRELSRTVRQRLSEPTGRHIHLVLESMLNRSAYMEPATNGGPRHFNAQWNDDFHHAAHILLTGETAGYFADFAENTREKLGRALAEGFIYQGEVSAFHDHQPRGTPSRHLPTTAFVNFLQNHDQIGNRALGEREVAIADPAALRAMTAIMLLAPQIPLLFMGEEWACPQPFLYFCDFHDELANAIRDGRKREFSWLPGFADAEGQERIPDPNSVETYAASKLDWNILEEPVHADWLAFYTKLLHVRRDAIMPILPLLQSGTYEVWGEGALRVNWPLKTGGMLTLIANLSAAPSIAKADPPGALLFNSASASKSGMLSAWSVAWYLDARQAALPEGDIPSMIADETIADE